MHEKNACIKQGLVIGIPFQFIYMLYILAKMGRYQPSLIRANTTCDFKATTYSQMYIFTLFFTHIYTLTYAHTYRFRHTISNIVCVSIFFQQQFISLTSVGCWSVTRREVEVWRDFFVTFMKQRTNLLSFGLNFQEKYMFKQDRNINVNIFIR